MYQAGKHGTRFRDAALEANTMVETWYLVVKSLHMAAVLDQFRNRKNCEHQRLQEMLKARANKTSKYSSQRLQHRLLYVWLRLEKKYTAT